MGKGAGDLNIKAISGIIFSEIYVEDCWWYKPTLDSDFTRTSVGTEYSYLLINPVALPSTFEIEFDTTRASTSAGVVYIKVGENTTNDYYDIGSVRNKGSLTIRNATALLADNNNNNIVPLSKTTNKYSYDGTKHTAISSVTLTANDPNANIGYFLGVVINQNSGCSLTEIKVKPL